MVTSLIVLISGENTGEGMKCKSTLYMMVVNSFSLSLGKEERSFDRYKSTSFACSNFQVPFRAKIIGRRKLRVSHLRRCGYRRTARCILLLNQDISQDDATDVTLIAESNRLGNYRIVFTTTQRTKFFIFSLNITENESKKKKIREIVRKF